MRQSALPRLQRNVLALLSVGIPVTFAACFSDRSTVTGTNAGACSAHEASTRLAIIRREVFMASVYRRDTNGLPFT